MKEYEPEPYDLTRPPHLLAKDVLNRIGFRNKCRFGPVSHADVEKLIRQYIAAIEKVERDLLNELSGPMGGEG